MKTKKEKGTKIVRNKYTAQFKGQALGRADRNGIPTVAKDLGLSESMLYSWRENVGKQGNPLKSKSSNKLKMARLKREAPGWKRKWPS